MNNAESEYNDINYPEIFERVFIGSKETDNQGNNVSLYTKRLGEINIQSNKLIVCDPAFLRDAKPFSCRFPNGKFPVDLAIAKYPDDERIAFSRIVFSDNPVTSWKIANNGPEEFVATTMDSEFGFSVDGGQCMFIDSEAAEGFLSEDSKRTNYWADIFITQFHNNLVPTWSYLVHTFDKYNLVVYSSGYGDGFYTAYVGYDKNGEVCKLLVDFQFFNW